MDYYRIVKISPKYKGIISVYWRIALLQDINDKSHSLSILLEPLGKNEASGIIVKKNGEYDPMRLDILKEENGKTLDSWKKNDCVSLF